MKQKTKKIIFVLEILLFIFLLLPIIFNNYIPIFFIQSNSMLPEIKKGDVVFVDKSNKPLNYYKDKIIAFYNPLKNKIIVHRVVNLHNEYLITKGDNNTFIDFFNPTINEIIGEVVYKW